MGEGQEDRGRHVDAAGHSAGDVLVPDSWHDLLAATECGRGTIMVIGATDAGKTVLCWWLAERLAESGSVAVVDADLGQSVLGPPGTVGWRLLGGDRDRFIFVGVTSPAARPLGTASATFLACRRAGEAADRVVLDTSGYVHGSGAVALKRAKTDLVRPSDVVLIEAEPGGLEPIARALRPGETRVHRLEAIAADRKSASFRHRWRQTRFEEHLRDAQVQAIPLQGRAVYGGRPWLWGRSWSRLASKLEGLLIGLSDAEGIGLAVGLLRGVRDRGETLLVLASPIDLDAVASIGLGTIRLREDGTQMREE